MPTEAELAAHVTRVREAQYLRHRQGHGIGLGFHEPPWAADGDHRIPRATWPTS